MIIILLKNNMVLKYYYINYTGEYELEGIISVINEYQQIYYGEIITDEEIGGVIEHICFARIVSKEVKEKKYMLIFGINYGVKSCKKFFKSRGISFGKFYYEFIDKYLEAIDKWYSYNEKYFSKDFVDTMYNNNYCNLFTFEQRENLLNLIKKDKTFWNEKIVEFDDKELSEIYREIEKNKLEERES